MGTNDRETGGSVGGQRVGTNDREMGRQWGRTEGRGPMIGRRGGSVGGQRGGDQ